MHHSIWKKCVKNLVPKSFRVKKQAKHKGFACLLLITSGLIYFATELDHHNATQQYHGKRTGLRNSRGIG